MIANNLNNAREMQKVTQSGKPKRTLAQKSPLFQAIKHRFNLHNISSAAVNISLNTTVGLLSRPKSLVEEMMQEI